MRKLIMLSIVLYILLNKLQMNGKHLDGVLSFIALLAWSQTYVDE